MPLSVTRESDTWCLAHYFPFFSNSTSVCQRPSECVRTHAVPPLTYTLLYTCGHWRAGAHTQARSVGPGRRGKERRALAFICLQLLSLTLFVSLSVHKHQCEDFTTTVTVITKETSLRTRREYVKQSTRESKTRRKRRKTMDKRSYSLVFPASFLYFILLEFTGGQFFPG